MGETVQGKAEHHDQRQEGYAHYRYPLLCQHGVVTLMPGRWTGEERSSRMRREQPEPIEDCRLPSAHDGQTMHPAAGNIRVFEAANLW